MACSAGAYTVSQAFIPVSTPRGTVLSRGTPSAQGGPADVPVRGSACGAAYAVSGTMLAVGASQASTAVSKRRAKVRVMALPQDGGAELAFTPGQEVTLLAPPAMAGRQGIIVEPDGDSFKVQLQSGAIFSFATKNIQAAAPLAPMQPATPAAAVPLPSHTAASAPAPAAVATPSKDHEELEYTPGQSVTILAPPALAGKPGTIVGPARGDYFAVQLQSGSVFNIAPENIEDASTPAPAQAQAPPAATAPGAAAAAQDDEELEFVPGQRVTILGPPALTGKKGSVLGLAWGESFAVQLDSGSVFHIEANNMQGAAAPAQPQAFGPAATSPIVAAAAQGDEDQVLSPGHLVTILAPAGLLGKRGTILGPAWSGFGGDRFTVQLESGSVFNIALENLQDAITQEPLQRVPVAAVPIPAVAPHDGEPEFAPGKQVAILSPPAVAGNRGTVVGPASGETVEVQFETGSVFTVATESIQDALAPAPARAGEAATPRPVPNVVSANTFQCEECEESEETEFQKGQVVEILAPPAAAGKQGTIGGHDSGDNWMVVLPSGNIFSVKAQNLKRRAMAGVMAGAEMPSFENRSKKLSPRSLRSQALSFFSRFGRR